MLFTDFIKEGKIVQMSCDYPYALKKKILYGFFFSKKIFFVFSKKILRDQVMGQKRKRHDLKNIMFEPLLLDFHRTCAPNS